MTKLPKFLVVAVLVAGCNDYSRNTPPLTDRFHYPVGMALRHLPAGCSGGAAGCRTILYVASSNFDLEFDPVTGGTLLAVDPDQAGHLQPLGPSTGRIGQGLRIGSYAGEVAVADEATCPGWQTSGRAPLALVASRSQNQLYRTALTAAGAPSSDPATCDQAGGAIQPLTLDESAAPSSCPVALAAATTSVDPYGVTVVCPTPAVSQAFVGFLSTPQGIATLVRLDLRAPLAPAPASAADPAANPVQFSPDTFAAIQSFAYHAARGRLFLTPRFYPGRAPIRWWDVANGYFGPAVDSLTRLDLLTLIPSGAEARGMAISSDGTRAYVALRLFDESFSRTYGARPADQAGALAVLDLAESPGGGPLAGLIHLVPLGKGPAEVRVVDRRAQGLRDLVGVTCTLDSTFYLYDDQVGALARVLGPDPAGSQLGRSVSGLAAEPFQPPGSPAGARFFVASFDQSYLSVVRVDDLRRPDLAAVELAVDAGATSGGSSCGTLCPSVATPGCPAACLVPRHIGPERK